MILGTIKIGSMSRKVQSLLSVGDVSCICRKIYLVEVCCRALDRASTRILDLIGGFPSKLNKSLVFKRSVIDSILTYAKMAHPKEGVLLLQGKFSKDKILVDAVVIPPLATHGQGFSSFPLFMLPSDLSVVGVAHSHPTGALEPSTHDLNSFYGRVMVIAAYPYESESDLAVFDGKGRSILYEIV